MYEEENNRIGSSLEQTINTANYVIQNHGNHPRYGDVYSRCIELLEAKATNCTTTGEHEKELIV